MSLTTPTPVDSRLSQASKSSGIHPHMFSEKQQRNIMGAIFASGHPQMKVSFMI